MSKHLALAALAACAAYAAPASALFDAELLVGKRWYDFEQSGTKNGVAATEINVAAHVDPIPLVPVAFGVSVSMIQPNKDDLGVDEAAIVEPAIELMARVPMVPIVTPYAKVKVPVLAKYATKDKDATGQETTVTGSLSGYHLNAGIAYSPLPLIRILLEAGLGMEKVKIDEFKVAGTKQSGVKDTDAKSKTLLVGIEIGL